MPLLWVDKRGTRVFIHLCQYGIYTVKADIHFDTSGCFSRYDISNFSALLFTFTLNVMNSNILCVIVL